MDKKKIEALLSQIHAKGLTDETKSVLIKELNEKPLTRTVEFTRDQIDEEKRIIKDLALASEDPYGRWFGIEILDHSEGAIRMDRLNNSAPFLADHDMSRDIGVIEPGSAHISKDKKLRITPRFSKSAENKDAQRIWDDTLDGIRNKVSVGYMIHELVLEKQTDEGPDIFRVTDWEPIEGSSVSIPADDTVGMGRSETITNATSGDATIIINDGSGIYIPDGNGTHFIDPDPPATKDIHNETDLTDLIKKAVREYKENETQLNNSHNNGSDITMKEKDENTAAAPAVKTQDEILADRQAEVGKIIALCAKHNISNDEPLKEGYSIEETRGWVLDQIADDAPLETPLSNIGLEGQDLKDYSIMNVVRYIMDPSNATAKAASHELAISAEVAKSLGKAPQGLWVPDEIGSKKILLPARRDLTAGGSATGTEFVATDLDETSFIELLRNKMLLFQLGARPLGGLVGNLDLPKHASGVSSTWLTSEGTALTEGTPGTGKLSLTPKDHGVYVDVTRRMRQQSSVEMDAFVLDDITTAVALARDLAGFHGTGSSGEPTGIASTSGIGAVAGTSLTWAKTVEFESDCDAGNALINNMAFVTTPAVRGALKARAKVSGGERFICEKNLANDYPMFTTSQITANNIFFGNFAQVIVATWGNGFDIYRDTAVTTGTETISIIETVDIGVRQPGAFSYCSDFS